MGGFSRSAIALIQGLAACAALCSPMAVSASDDDMRLIVPGGELDPDKRPLDIYLETPVKAQADPSTACRHVEEYVRRVNEGRYAEVADLFTADAVFMEPNQSIARGTAQIRDFYVNYIGAMKPSVIPVAFVGNKTECMVMHTSGRQIDGQLRYGLASINHFSLGENGRFKRMIAFPRQQAPQLASGNPTGKR